MLASDVVATIDVPGFDRSAMDGYGLRGDETSGASEYNPISFPVEGQVLPGAATRPCRAPRSAIRIMTGAPIPSGVDAVVPAEFASESAGSIEITRPVAPGQHVAHRGEDVATGTTVLRAGGACARRTWRWSHRSARRTWTSVRRPRVRIVATGNEVVAPGADEGAVPGLRCELLHAPRPLARDGGVLETRMRLGDDPQADSRGPLARART